MASNGKPLTQIVAALSPGLESAGFRRHQLIFTRSAEQSVYHVIEFQPNKYITRSDFTINLGVFIEGVSEALGRGHMGHEGLTEADCQLRKRLGTLATGHDVWWSWKDPQAVIAELGKLFQENALPLLAQYSSRPAIVALWKRQGRRFWPGGVNPLQLAALLVLEDESAAAQSLLEDELAQSEGPGAEGVRKTMKRFGFGVPA